MDSLDSFPSSLPREEPVQRPSQGVRKPFWLLLPALLCFAQVHVVKQLPLGCPFSPYLAAMGLFAMVLWRMRPTTGKERGIYGWMLGGCLLLFLGSLQVHRGVPFGWSAGYLLSVLCIWMIAALCFDEVSAFQRERAALYLSTLEKQEELIKTQREKEREAGEARAVLLAELTDMTQQAIQLRQQGETQRLHLECLTSEITWLTEQKEAILRQAALLHTTSVKEVCTSENVLEGKNVCADVPDVQNTECDVHQIVEPEAILDKEGANEAAHICDQTLALKRALAHAEGRYSQLRLQFDEKGLVLDQTRREVFRLEGECEKLQRERTFSSSEEENEAWARYTSSLIHALEEEEVYIASLESLIASLS